LVVTASVAWLLPVHFSRAVEHLEMFLRERKARAAESRRREAVELALAARQLCGGRGGGVIIFSSLLLPLVLRMISARQLCLAGSPMG